MMPHIFPVLKNRYRSFLVLLLLTSLLMIVLSALPTKHTSAQVPTNTPGPTGVGTDNSSNSSDNSSNSPTVAANLKNLPTDQIIIKYRPSSRKALFAADAAQLQALSQVAGQVLTYFRPMSGGDTHVLRLPGRIPLDKVKAIAARLKALPDVVYAEPDAILMPIGSPLDTVPVQTNNPLLLANDPQFSNQWDFTGPYGINAPAAWNESIGSLSIVVAVIDTGITNHAEFVGRTVPGYDFISNVPNANDGNGRDSSAADPGDWITSAEAAPGGYFYGCGSHNSSWHGTHTAGTIGAKSNNGVGVAGINWTSKILPVRVLGKCGGTTSDIVDGMYWAAGLSVPGVPANANPAKVLSISLGGPGSCSQMEQDAVTAIKAAGAVVVVAAGNETDDPSFYTPASCNGVITVGATDRYGDMAYYSNYGSSVEISAPGGAQSGPNDPNGILSTLNTGTTGPVADTYVYYQGTSMATPHVAGVVSLILSKYPLLTPDEVLAKLQSSVTPFPAGSTCNTSICGSGILNAAAALDGPLPTSITSFTPTSGGAGTSVTITGVSFTGATGVQFDGISASYIVDSDTQITATVPSGAITGPISVFTPLGSDTSSTDFTNTDPVPPPVITSFTPATGSAGTIVTITGRNYVDVSEIRFNGSLASFFTVVSNKSITATVPVGATTGPITITTATGSGQSSTNFTVSAAANNDLFANPFIVTALPFTRSQPIYGTTVSASDPSFTCLSSMVNTVWYRFTATADQTYLVSTIGSNFGGSTDTVLAVFTGTEGNLTEVACNDDIGNGLFTSSLTFDGTAGTAYYILAAKWGSTPASTTASLVVNVNALQHWTGSTNQSLSMSFDVAANHASQSQFEIEVQVSSCTMTNTFSWAPPRAIGNPFSYSSSSFAFSGTFTSATTANGTFSIPYHYEPGCFDYISYSGGTWNATFSPPPVVPTITSFTPASGPIGTLVTITGTNLTGATDVLFNGVSATGITPVSATSLKAVVPSGASTGQISVITPSGTGTSATNFTFVPPPTITSFTPDTGPYGTVVTITGTGFTGATSVKFNGTTASFTVLSATSVRATLPTGSTPGPITVTTANGTATSSTDFIAVPPPAITSFTPTSGLATTTVTITGNYFSNASAVKFNTLDAANFTVDSATQITATVPTGALNGPIRITTPGGTGVSSTDFTVPVPAPSGLAASTVSQTQINLSWTDNSSDETSFKIERSLNGSTGWVEIASVGANVTSYPNTLLDCNTTYYYQVRAYRSGDSAYSLYTSANTTTSACTLGIPTLVSPADTTLTSNNMPVFSWSAVASADAYQIQVDNNSDFSSPEINTNVAGLSYSSKLADATTYSWRVRALASSNSQTGLWSTVWTVRVDTVRLAAPTLSLPANMSNVTVTTPTFSWLAVAGATQYYLEVDDDPAFGSPLPHLLGNVLSYKLPVSDGLIYGNTYYWRVKAAPVSAAWSNWSLVRSITLTIMSAPANGAYSLVGTPTFTWIGVAGAAGYKLQITPTTDPNFLSPIRDVPLGATTLYALPVGSALGNGTYLWRVGIVTGIGQPQWMASWTLTVTTPLPVAPTLGAPALGLVTNDTTPDLTWNTVATAVDYQVQIAAANTFFNPVQDVRQAQIAGTQLYTASALADGLWYWRVRAINTFNTAGAWSAIRSFTVDTTPPAAPKLLTPGDWATTTALRPTFSWQAVPGAARYTLTVFGVIGSDPAVCDTVPVFTTNPAVTVTTYAIPLTSPALINATSYCWQVQANDALNNPVGGISSQFHLRVNTTLLTGPAAPTLSTPANAISRTNATLPDFTWTGAINSNTFQIQIDNLSTFASPERDVVTVSPSYPASSALPLPAGVNYWRVRGINASGVAGAWSVVRSFTLINTTPAVPVVLAPIQGSFVNTLHPTLKWQAIAGATGYHVQWATDSGFTTNLVNKTFPGTVTAYTLTEFLSWGTSYYWHVSAVNAATTESDFSPTTQFTVSVHNAPANGAFTLAVRPGFTWQVVATGASYTLQIATDSGFTSLVPGVGYTGPLTSYTIPAAAPALSYGTYYWRVIVTVAPNPSVPMPGWSFTVSPNTPAVPVLSSPATAALTNDNTPTLNWKTALNAQRYEIQIDDVATFASPQEDVTTAPGVLSYTTNTLPDGLYYWRVRSLNSYGTPSGWTAAWTITIDTTPPAIPVVVGPADGTFVTNTMLNLRWNTVAGATNYQVRYGTTNPPATPPIPVGNVLTYHPPSIAQNTYFWQVRALDAAGNASAWTTARGFTVVAGISMLPTEPTDTSKLTATPTATPTVLPTETVLPEASPTAEPDVVPTNTPVPSVPLTTVEAESSIVSRTGSWSVQATSSASGGQYIYSSGGTGDGLSMTFSGSHVTVVYVKHPALGSFAIEIDGVAYQTVNETADATAFDAQVSVDNLGAGSHTLKISAVTGTIAVDAFAVEAVVEPSATPTTTPIPEQTATAVPTLQPTEQSLVEPTSQASLEPTTQPSVPPTATPIPQIYPVPFSDGLDSPQGWSVAGNWTLDATTAYSGASWFATSATRNTSSTLTTEYLITLQGALYPQISFWQKMTLTHADSVVLDISTDNGISWQPLDTQIGSVADWAQHTVSLSAYSGQTVQLRFRLDTFGTVPDGLTTVGYWIDDLVVADVPPVTLPPVATSTAVPTDISTPTELPATVLPSPTPTDVMPTPMPVPTDTPVPTDVPPLPSETPIS